MNGQHIRHCFLTNNFNRWYDIYHVKDKKELVFIKFFVCFFSVGKPIPVIKTENPTEVQIEEVHSTYVQALKELYEEYNPIYGDEKVKLVFE